MSSSITPLCDGESGRSGAMCCLAAGHPGDHAHVFTWANEPEPTPEPETCGAEHPSGNYWCTLAVHGDDEPHRCVYQGRELARWHEPTPEPPKWRGAAHPDEECTDANPCGCCKRMSARDAEVSALRAEVERLTAVLTALRETRHRDGEYPWHCAVCAAVHALPAPGGAA